QDGGLEDRGADDDRSGVHEGASEATGVAGVLGEVAAVAEDHVDFGEIDEFDLDLRLLLHHRLRHVLHHGPRLGSDVRSGEGDDLHQTSSSVFAAVYFFTAGMISEPMVSIWPITFSEGIPPKSICAR